MGAKSIVDPTYIVQSLVHTLLDVFDATRDLHQTLQGKEKRDYAQSLRSRGYSAGRRFEYMDEEDNSGDESIVMDKAAVNRRFELGLREVGSTFAVGDVITQAALQTQIITLQSVLITAFLYGPSTSDPISKHLSKLVSASREAGTTAVDALGAQQLRQLAMLPPVSRSSARSPETHSKMSHVSPYPKTKELALSRLDHKDHGSPYKTPTTIVDRRPTAPRSDTESTVFSGPTAHGPESPQTTCCLYALDLQRHPSQPLSSSITRESTPYCPYCKRTLHLSPGKSWEVFKDDRDRVERCFRLSNRFVVKCHRDTPDGGYCCVMCSQGSSVDTVCGDVKALIKHVWQDHDARELEREQDVEELVEMDTVTRRGRSGKSVERRRDSAFGTGSRRSVSLGPVRGRRGRRFEREVQTVAVR